MYVGVQNLNVDEKSHNLSGSQEIWLVEHVSKYGFLIVCRSALSPLNELQWPIEMWSGKRLAAEQTKIAQSTGLRRNSKQKKTPKSRPESSDSLQQPIIQ